MANPFLGQSSTHSPSSVTDHYGDSTWFDQAHFHVAGLLLLALVVLTAMQMTGFRAMVGIGRG